MKTVKIQVPDWVDENLVKELAIVVSRYEAKKLVKDEEKIISLKGVLGKAKACELKELEDEVLL